MTKGEQIEKYVKTLLASKQPIVLDNKLMRGLGYDSTRELFEALGNWGYNTDFGHLPDATDTNVQSYLKQFIKSFLE